MRIPLASVRHFPDLSWIIEDLRCFFEVRSFKADMLSCCFFFFFVQASFNLFALSTCPLLLCFLHCLLNPPVCFPVLFCSFCFIPPLQISPLITEVENIFGDPRFFPETFFPKYLTGCIRALPLILFILSRHKF